MEIKTRSTLPRVAVLLSTYNGENVVEAQLESLLAQRGVVVDVIARDDGSTDCTLAILARYAKYWPRLAVPMDAEHLGITASYLRLLKTAPDGYEGYAFCDQDDVWLPEKLAWATARLAEADAARPTLYCSSVICVDDNMRRLGKKSLGHDTRFEHLLFENVSFGAASVQNSAARTLICSKMPDTRALAPDWWCALLVSAFGDIICDDRPTILYRQHNANTTGANPNHFLEFAGRLRAFLSNPRGFYQIHAQTEELLRLYGAELSPGHRAFAEKLVASRGSIRRRISYALFGKVMRSDLTRAAAVRALIAAGLY